MFWEVLIFQGVTQRLGRPMQSPHSIQCSHKARRLDGAAYAETGQAPVAACAGACAAPFGAAAPPAPALLAAAAPSAVPPLLGSAALPGWAWPASAARVGSSSQSTSSARCAAAAPTRAPTMDTSQLACT